MTEELKEIGLDVGHRRVGRLMRQNGISVVRTRKHKVTTDSDHKFNIAPNLLDRDFASEKSNQKWAGDISYVWARESCLYLSLILDLHSRRVISWAVSNRMKRDWAIRALKMAIARRAPPRGCIHHTDRGSQYCSHDFQKPLRQHGFKVTLSRMQTCTAGQWMSGKGNSYDNAAMVIKETTHSWSPLSIDRGMTGYRLPVLQISAGRANLAFCPGEERELSLQQHAVSTSTKISLSSITGGLGR